MRARAGVKKVALELGGNAGLIVDETADPVLAADRTVRGAFKHAGQLCISVQRAYVHRSVFDHFVDRLVEGAAKLRVGHPLDESVDLGPMISLKAADQFMTSLAEAESAGAKILEGGDRDGAYVRPTVITNVPREARLCAEEAFAPVVVVTPFDDFGQALAEVNDSAYGLQAGVFTRDLHRAWAAFEDLDVGGVVINDVPTFRADNMPYGGNKGSGEGREGIKFALEHMTDLRLMVLSPDVAKPVPDVAKPVPDVAKPMPGASGSADVRTGEGHG
jgi:glyceraldehyde-3-phosphate dehydrogenase (NADP+)